MGDRVTGLPLTWTALSIAVMVLIVIIGFSQAKRIEAWGRAYVTHRMSDEVGRSK